MSNLVRIVCLLVCLFVGISTGGVAEVFETNSPSGDEVILLKERRGLIKLAFRTGAELVPWCVLQIPIRAFSPIPYYIFPPMHALLLVLLIIIFCS